MSIALRLTRRGTYFVVAAAGLWASWLLIGLRDVWYLASLLAAMAGVAWLSAVALSLRARPDARLSVADPTPMVGDTVVLTATVTHRLPYPVRARILWEVDGERLSMPCTAGTSTSTAVRTAWKPGKRGAVTARIVAVSVVEPLGLSVRRARSSEQTTLLVLPRPYERLPALIEGDEPGTAEGSATRPHPDHGAGAPGGAVREYRAGDAPRQIHWKQSARQGELLVNMHDRTHRRERSLLLSTDAEDYRSGSDFDAAVSAAAAIGQRWIRAGSRVRLHLGTEDSVACASETALLRALAVVQPGAAQAEPLPLLSVVVTGTVSEGFAERLHETGGGTLFALREVLPGLLPAGWQTIVLPSPNADAGHRE